MKIKQMTTQYRRDFTAIMVCEHCEHEQVIIHGYDDAFYHQNVIPKMECDSCGKVAPENYEPRQTKYPEGMQV